MQILVLFSLNERTSRNTINEHLYSFETNGDQHDFHYVNVFTILPNFLFWIEYDAVILHYTFLAEKRFLENEFAWNQKIKNLNKVHGYKIAIPQDEYDVTDRLNKVFKEGNINIIYTCFTNLKDIERAYPKSKTGVEKVKKVFTGYINQEIVQSISSKHISYENRPIDIGYRARKLPAHLGRHGQLKSELVDVFNNFLIGSGLNTDIRNTNDNFIIENTHAIKLGFTWYDFLLSCKAFIGCEGGSSLLDTDGSIKREINNYVAINPSASFKEIEDNCFPGKDYNIKCFALSPRHFEAAMTKTLQILVEGEYGGVFKPWVHYVPLKKDFSNIEEVLAFLKDIKACEEIISNAYQDIVLSGHYTYRMFVSEIFNDITAAIGQNPPRYNKTLFLFYKRLIEIRNITSLYGYLIIKKIKNILKLYILVSCNHKKL